MADTLRSVFPELYARLLPALFDAPAPKESKATCASCAMCAPPGAHIAEGTTYFRPDAKCCTYHPQLPNYLVGAILADARDDMAEGRRRMLAKIAARAGVTPQWIAAPRKTSLLQRGARNLAFGRSLVLLCPYFERDGGLCTIWRHRETVCSTFFCKYDDGAEGQRFWRATRDLMEYVERRLSHAAARAVLPKHDETLTDDLTVEDLEDRPPSDAAYASLWGTYVGREADLYLATHAWVQALDPEQFAAIVMDDAYATRAAKTTSAKDALASRDLPTRLVANPEMTRRPVPNGVLVTGYSRYEPLHLTPALDLAVHAFHAGETVAEVRARLARDEQIEVPDELVLALYRYRVLVDAAQAR